jgi:hypothetical protein
MWIGCTTLLGFASGPVRIASSGHSSPSWLRVLLESFSLPFLAPGFYLKAVPAGSLVAAALSCLAGSLALVADSALVAVPALVANPALVADPALVLTTALAAVPLADPRPESEVVVAHEGEVNSSAGRLYSPSWGFWEDRPHLLGVNCLKRVHDMAHAVGSHLHRAPPGVNYRDLLSYRRPRLLAVSHTHQVERRPRSHVLGRLVGHQRHLRPRVPERYARSPCCRSYPLRHELDRQLRLQLHRGRDRLCIMLPRCGGGLPGLGMPTGTGPPSTYSSWW